MTMKSAFFLIVGLMLIVGAAMLATDDRQFVRQAIRAPGVVSALRAGGGHPQITFRTATRQTVSYPQNGWIAGYKVGDPVTVLYRADDPRGTASIDAIGAVWAAPILLFVLGFGFCVLAIGDILHQRKA